MTGEKRAPDPGDLGFGAAAERGAGQRMINRDGSFHVVRKGFGFLSSLHLYHVLLTLSWFRFVALALAAYLSMNVGFALVYMLAGVSAAETGSGVDLSARFLDSFFFSVQTSATIGYGEITPGGVVSNLVVTFESFVSLLGLALITGLVFARFARPVAHLLYSARAVVAPFRGGEAFMFRLVNGRNNQLIEAEIQVMFTKLVTRGGVASRTFHSLSLERDRIAFLPLSWTIVHPITAASPLKGETPTSLAEGEVEFLVQVKAIDETFSQTVHSRTSYTARDVIFGHRFVRMFDMDDVGRPAVLHRDRLDLVEPVRSPSD